MNRRFETYIILGTYFALGLIFGYIIGKQEVNNKTYIDHNYGKFIFENQKTKNFSAAAKKK